jgi:hypothetical protein
VHLGHYNLRPQSACICLWYATSASGYWCTSMQPTEALSLVGSLMESQKNASMQLFLSNTKKGLLLDTNANSLTLSSIFEWFETDFSTFQYPTLNGGQVCPRKQSPQRHHCSCMINGGVGQAFGSTLEFIEAFSAPDVSTYLQAHQSTITTKYFAYNWKLNSFALSGPPLAYH